MRAVLFILLSLSLFGCMAKKLAVDNADTLLSHQLQKRLPLTPTQQNELDTDIVKLLKNMKPGAQEILPVIDKIKLENNPEIVEEQYYALEVFYRKMASNFSELISRHMAKLDAKQQQKFFATLEKEDTQIKKKSQVDRSKEIEGRVKMFLGTIEPSQKAILNGYKDYFHSRTDLRLKNRKTLHDEFRHIYSEQIPEESKAELFQKAFLTYQDKSINTEKNLEIIKKILPTLLPKQRTYFREKIEEMKELINYFLLADY